MHRLASTQLLPFVFILLSFSVLLALSACGSRSQWERESAELHRQRMDLERRQQSLDASIDSLWDATSKQLEDALPAGFPPTDRDIFLKARNADHIRMFMSFKLLDADAQALVNRAGQQDERLAAQARALLEARQAFERQKILFLQKVGREDKAAGQRYASQFRTVTTENYQ